MKTFKDVTFKQHKLGKGHIQGLLMLDNGIELSIVAGSGMYSTSKNGARAAVNNVKDVASFEVAVINKMVILLVILKDGKVEKILMS